MDGPLQEKRVSSASIASHDGTRCEINEFNDATDAPACPRQSSGSGSKKDSIESVVSVTSSEGEPDGVSPATVQVEFSIQNKQQF